MKPLTLIFILLTFAATSAAQENCPLPEAPAIFGLKLNMSPEEAQAAVGKDLKIKVKKADETNIFQNYIKKSPPPALSGARAIYLRFFDRKLYQIEIFYEDSAGIKTLKDFTDSLSAKWNLPFSAWQPKRIGAEINCGRFSIAAMKILNPRIELTDEAARARVEAVRNEKSKKK